MVVRFSLFFRQVGVLDNTAAIFMDEGRAGIPFIGIPTGIGSSLEHTKPESGRAGCPNEAGEHGVGWMPLEGQDQVVLRLLQSCVALAIEVGMEKASWENFILWGS